jgi:hypothetical protein
MRISWEILKQRRRDAERKSNMSKWISGGILVSVASGVGYAMHYALTSDQVAHVATYGDQAVAIGSAVVAAITAFVLAVRGAAKSN